MNNLVWAISWIAFSSLTIPPAEKLEEYPQRWTVNQWNAPTDLPNEVVRDVIQASDGTVWIATWGGGLVKMRGTQKEIVDTEDGLISNDVRTIREDRRQRLWVGTRNGISCISSEGIYNFSSQTHSEIPGDDSVYAIECLENGEVWFGNGIGFLYSWIPSQTQSDLMSGSWKQIHHFNNHPNIGIRQIRQVSENNIILALNKLGLIQIQKNNRGGYDWRYFPRNHPYLSPTMGFLISDTSRTISVGGRDLIEMSIDEHDEQDKYIGTNFNSKCIQSAFNKVFIGTEQGLYILENDRLYFCPLTSDRRKLNIESLSTMKDGSLWVGTRSGVYRLKDPIWKQQYPSEEKVQTQGRCLAQDEKNQLFLLDGKGQLWIYTNNTWRLVLQLEPDFFSSSPTVDLVVKQNRIVVMAFPLLTEIDLKSQAVIQTTYLPNDMVFGTKNHMYLSNTQGVWITGNKGVIRHKKNEIVPVFPTSFLAKQEVYSILETAPDEYWIGGQGWIERLRNDCAEKIRLPESINISDSPILDSLELQNKELWFSILGQGILRFQENQWLQDNMKSGFPSNYIWTLFQSYDGTIWAGDRINGIMSFRDNRWVSYGFEEGIPVGAVLSIVEDQDCSIWIAVENEGIYKYQPEHNPPNVEIVSSPKELVPDAQGVFSFQGYDAWRETPTEELVYSWRILSKTQTKLINPWSAYTLETSALTPPLKPGEYIFEVRAQDKCRNTSLAAQTTIHVIPYLWMDYRFQLPVLLSVGLGLALLQQWWRRYQKVLHSERKYKSMVEQDTHTLILHWDSDWTLVYANECAQKTLGLQVEDIHSFNVMEELFSGDASTQAEFLQAHEQSLQSPDSHQLRHFSSPGASGDIRQISWLFRVVHKEPGSARETHAFGIDITRQRNIETELHRERIGFQEFCEAAHIGVFRLSLSGELLYANAALAEILGFGSLDEMMRYPQPIPWFRDRRVSSFVQSIRSQERMQPTVWRGKQPVTGQEISVLLYGVVKGEELEIMTLDLTQQKRLEKEIVRTRAQEQQKIGRDLHDSVVQDLTGISFLGQCLLSQWQEKPVEGVENLRRIVENVDEVRQRIRKITKGLSPIHLGKLGFQSALEEIAQTVQNLYGIKCVCDLDSTVTISNLEDEMNLYLIAHEALMNAAKHSQAQLISLRLSQDEKTVALTVQDNGTGITPTEKRGGMGIQIMQYRAEMIGAELRIETRPGEGTRVECRYPRLQMV